MQLYAVDVAVGTPVTLSAGSWSHTWTKLPECANPTGRTGNQKQIRYTVEEIGVPSGYVSVITGSQTGGYTITNTKQTGKLVIEKKFDILPKSPEPTPEETPEPEVTPTPTPPVETVNVPVTKTWNDGNDADGIRPSKVTVRLYADGEPAGSGVLSESNGWSYNFTDLPRFNGEAEIKYTITEDPVKGYTSEIKDYQIVNTHVFEVTEVSVQKVWDDNENKLGLRPKSICVTLSNGTAVVLNKANNWSATVGNLPAKANGKPIEYTWKEQVVLGYKQLSKITKDNVTVITNGLVTTPPPGDKPPKRPGPPTLIINDYGTPLGVEIAINHVGDCFD